MVSWVVYIKSADDVDEKDVTFYELWVEQGVVVRQELVVPDWVRRAVHCGAFGSGTPPAWVEQGQGSFSADFMGMNFEALLEYAKAAAGRGEEIWGDMGGIQGRLVEWAGTFASLLREQSAEIPGVYTLDGAAAKLWLEPVKAKGEA